MRNVVVFVLGGGRGTRLYPLTKYRSKPAVPLAGKYRIIDIPISNCINSGMNHIYVLTQFHSVSIHRHIRRTYTFSPFDGGFVEILAAQQTLQSEDWYQGTADAVRQNLQYLKQPGLDYVLILSGDQLYRMNYADLLDTHRQAGADATIAAVPVSREAASALGIMRVDDTGRVVGFVEKPKTDEALAPALTDPAWIDARGIASRGRECLANMGIYLFNRDTLVEMLEGTEDEDFGKQIFPQSIDSYRVQVHLFDGYWEDIGTVKAFYEANLALAAPDPPFELGSAEAPIYTRGRFLPPSRIEGATVRGSLVADGCFIEDGAVIENSVIGLRCRIGRDVTVRNSVVLGADYYEGPESIASARARGEPRIGIATGTRIEGAIVDKNCRIGDNVRVLNESGVESSDETEQYMICDGIVVIPKASVLPDEWTV